MVLGTVDMILKLTQCDNNLFAYSLNYQSLQIVSLLILCYKFGKESSLKFGSSEEPGVRIPWAYF